MGRYEEMIPDPLLFASCPHFFQKGIPLHLSSPRCQEHQVVPSHLVEWGKLLLRELGSDELGGDQVALLNGCLLLCKQEGDHCVSVEHNVGARLIYQRRFVGNQGCSEEALRHFKSHRDFVMKETLLVDLEKVEHVGDQETCVLVFLLCCVQTRHRKLTDVGGELDDGL